MAKETSIARNWIKRALSAVLDRELNDREKDLIWKFFDSKCAYCRRSLDRGDRQAHIDHLVPNTAGGINHISNRVLSCGSCNDEKREAEWISFLRMKARNAREFKARRKRIEAWISEQTSNRPGAVNTKLLRQETDRVIAAFNKSVSRLRQARTG